MADKSKNKTPTTLSRYQQVKRILNEAAGNSQADYQGYGKFWELPLAEFLELEIYGVRMIAPEGDYGSGADTGEDSATCCTAPPDKQKPKGNSCCGAPEDGEPARACPGRGAASGLVKGLKGEFPFNGSQFPALPWGGKPVSASDIQFIQDWIDDGCPETDAPRGSIEVKESVTLARARGDEEHPQSTTPVNDFHQDAGTLKVRKNVAFLSPEELLRFRNAIKTMKCYDKFATFDRRSFLHWANIHANLCQHGWEEFLSWHRLYLYNFEKQLQEVDPTVTLPYWDWPMYKADVEKSIEDMSSTTALDNGVIPEAYRCWIDDDALKNLKGKIPADTWQKLDKIKDQKFDSGPRLFAGAGITYGKDPAADDAIISQLLLVNPLWDRFRWPGGNKSLIFEAYPTPEDIDRILQIENFFTFGSGPSDDHFFGALENIHNLLHNFSGGANPNFNPNNPDNPNEPQYGDMVSPGTTARDPIFWGHHSNVDRLWAEWQKLHPNTNPDNLSAILAPWTLNVQQVLSTQKLGYEYMKSSHLFETDNSVAITRFKSANAGVHPAVLAAHRRAEIRLHKIQYAVAGGAFIRVFLNEPNANVETPTKGNDHFVTQVATFSGACIGGPGHCDVPPETRPKFDHRPRPHKTPSNFRIDATETVRKLSAKGETDMNINLVVLGVDGKQKDKALWLDAVSLNFID